MRTAETELARKKKRMADLEGLLKQGFITEDEVEEGRIDLDSRQVKLWKPPAWNSTPSRGSPFPWRGPG